MKRLGNRPQFVSHEVSVEKTRRYLTELKPKGTFAFHTLQYPNHTDLWALRDVPLRREARKWMNAILEAK